MTSFVDRLHPTRLAAARGSRRTMLALTLAMLVAAIPAPAQDVVSGVFVDILDVRVINVEVVVTDAEGKRVSGLTAEDFRLLVDDEAVAVDYFFEVQEGRAKGQREVLARVPGLAEQVDEASAEDEDAPLSFPMRTNYLVFIDEFFAQPAQRRLVLEKVLEDLQAIEPQDRVAAITFDGRHLDLVLDWTSSAQEIEETLREIMRRTAQIGLAEQKAIGLATNANDERFAAVATGQDSLATGGGGEHYMKKMLRDRLALTYHSVGAAMRGSAQVPGRRVMLLLSGGWPRDPSTFATGVGASSPLWKANTELAKLSDIANQTGFTIYGIDVPGSRNRALTAEAIGSHPLDPKGGSSGGGGAEGRPRLPAPRQLGSGVLEANQRAFDLGAGREHETEATLLVLAEQTGGRALLDGQRLNALAAAVDDTRSYYSLGFNRRQVGDDRYHTIEVEAVRPGLKVRARKGFTDLSRSSEVDWLVESALLLDHQTALPRLEIDLGEPQADGRRSVQLPVTITIPLAEIAPVPTAEGGRTLLELRVAALAEKGDRSDIATIPLELDLTHGMMAAPYLEYETVLRLKRQSQTLVLTLFDRVSGTVMLSRIDVEL